MSAFVCQNIESILPQLRIMCGDRVDTSFAMRLQHGSDETWNLDAPPDIVIFVKTTQEVSDIMTLCHLHTVPVIAYGVGSSLEGHYAAICGGICLDFSMMNAVLEVNEKDMDCRVEAGVTRKQLNMYLRDKGLFFPIDPGADASIGGMAATRASGTNAVRYGTMRDNVLNLTVVMADGQIINTAKRARKSAAGYDLTRLFIGSEGTLGLITQIQLKLALIPEIVISGVCHFNDLRGACETATEVLQYGIPIARMELLDNLQITAFNSYAKYHLPEKPTLFVEFHARDRNVITHEVSEFKNIAEQYGGTDIQIAEKTEDRNRLWKARHELFWANKSHWPGKDTLSTDVCVPISSLAECITQTHNDIKETNLVAPIVGHVGDGNFHVLIMFDKSSQQDVQKVKGFCDRLAQRAIDMQGTCTGEHGVGIGKRDYLLIEFGPAINVMRDVKRSLDPKNILNPNKIIVL